VSYAVKEIFLTLQGEGAHAGRAAVFCRFSGCNLWTGREQDRAALDRGTGLPLRLAQCHGGRHGDIERAQTRPDRDQKPRVGRRRDLVGNPCRFPPEQQDVVLAVAEIQIRTGPPGRKQHQPQTRVVTPLFEF